MKFEKKIAAGALFFQTQAIFNPERFKTFMEEARLFKVKIIAGILLLRSARMARYVTANIPGIKVPPPWISRLERAAGPAEIEVGLALAVETIDAIRPFCDGVHIMAVGAEDRIPDILERAGLRPVGACVASDSTLGPTLGGG